MNITGRTRVVGLYGCPVEHSLSPALHNAAFERLALDYSYVPFTVRPELLELAVKGIRALNLVGVNITVPHKEKVIPFLDEVSEEASFIGAVNTIRNKEGRLEGYNTDGRGFMRSLSEAGVEVRDRRVLIIGAGGAARAVGYYLCKEASVVHIYNRDQKRAESLRQHLIKLERSVLVADEVSVKSRVFLSKVDIVVNTTPLGLHPEDRLPLDIAMLQPRHVVCDLIYRETPLLAEASQIGCKTLNGLGMLLWQGVLAFEIWTGIVPPVEVMREALLRGGES